MQRVGYAAPMQTQDGTTALAVLTVAAAEAAALLMEGYRNPGPVRKKGRIDLVTDYDLRAEALLRKHLTRALPDALFVAEESAEESTTNGDGPAGLTLYVDPLDGTTNFAHGHPCFAVSVALYDGATAIAGVVNAPALGTCWQGARGQGALRNGRPCHVSPCTDFADALCATGFPYDRQTNPDNNLKEHAAFLMRTQGVRRCGSAAIDLSLVADGTYDLYWERNLKPWDLCAGALLVAEAGGKTSGYDGAPADARTGELVATNGHLHQAVVELLDAVRR